MFEIRKAGPEDIPVIRDLTFRIWPQTYSPIISAAQIDYMLEMMYSESSLINQMTVEGCQFIIIYDNGQPVGFASYNETGGDIWKLNKIYILPEQQGKGTGRFMLNFIITSIKLQNARALQLQVNRYNKAKEFYEKAGFQVIHVADFDIGNGYFMNDYVMEKKLED